MQKRNNLWAILYVSSAMKNLSPADVEYYLNLNKEFRIKSKITGIVVLAQNNVLVLQEGEKENVKAEFEAEKKHPAHHSLIKVFDGPIEGLYFEDFPLAFKPIGNPDLAHLDVFTQPNFKEYLDEILNLDQSVPRIIKEFIQNNS